MPQRFSSRASLRQVAFVSATGLTLIFATSPSFADGGAGGNAGGATGGAGGTGFVSNVGGDGSIDGGTNTGSGGGGGGSGGSGFSVNPGYFGTDGAAGGNGGGGASGGAGGNPNGGNGADAVADSGGGGGGGGGGKNRIATLGSVFALNDSYSGGDGGNGGDGALDLGGVNGGSGGGGGAGGASTVSIVDNDSSRFENFISTGGNGGDGGDGAGSGFGGVGGDGGDGIVLGGLNPDVRLDELSGVIGGNGGTGGTDGDGIGVAADGAGGVGIRFLSDSGLARIAGTVVGGMSGDGVTQANAITFAGSNNTLLLSNGYSITGNVVADGSGDALILGGTSDSSFDASKVGAAAQYRGFESFEKTGTSTWTLLNTTSAVTDWTISAGTLRVGSDGALGGTSSALVLDGGTLQFSSFFTLDATRDISIGDGGGTIDLMTNPMQIDQGITGTGGLTITSDDFTSSILLLNGVNTYTGDTTIDSVTVFLGDAGHMTASIAGNVYVTSGLFAGVGTVQGNLTNTGGFVGGGTALSFTELAGTLRVGGNFTQGASGAYGAYITPAGSTLLDVTGTANLAGALTVSVTPGVYTPRAYTILTASSVVGTFDSYSTFVIDAGNTEGIDDGDSVSYTGNSVIYTLGNLIVDPTNTAVVSTQGTVAVSNAQNANDTLLGAMDTMGSSSGGAGTAMNSKGYVRLALADDSKLAGILAPVPESVRTSVWTKVLGNLTSVDASNGKTGFDAKTGGVMVGADRSIGDGFTLGVAGSYSYTDVEDDLNSSSTINTGRVALYGRYAYGIYGIDAVLGYGHEWFDADRLVGGQVATSSHEGDEVNAAIAASVKLQTGDYVVTPKAGVGYVHFWEGDYTEQGAPGFNLNVSAREIDSLRPFASVDVTRSFETAGGTKMTPYVSAEYSREVMDNAPSSTVSVGGGSFIVNGVAPSRDRVSLGAGIDVALDKSMSLQIGYKAVLPTGNLVEHAVDAGFIYKF